MSRDSVRAADTVEIYSERVRALSERGDAHGLVLVEWHDLDGELRHSEIVQNLITSAGDAGYVARGAGVGSVAAPAGMKLGTGTTAVAKTGAGAALVAYLAGSNKAFDATFPSVAGNVVTYKRTFAAGEATSASTPITEAVIVNDVSADATTNAAGTWARFLLASPGPKAAADVLTITWTHAITGS